MKTCDLTSGVGRMKQATKILREQWLLTREVWADETARKFEEQYLQPLLPQMQLTLAAVNRFAEVMEKAEKECGDEEPVY
jgi:hypothetical protein